VIEPEPGSSLTLATAVLRRPVVRIVFFFSAIFAMPV
jgi:hypothetical protein